MYKGLFLSERKRLRQALQKLQEIMEKKRKIVKNILVIMANDLKEKKDTMTSHKRESGGWKKAADEHC